MVAKSKCFTNFSSTDYAINKRWTEKFLETTLSKAPHSCACKNSIILQNTDTFYMLFLITVMEFGFDFSVKSVLQDVTTSPGKLLFALRSCMMSHNNDNFVLIMYLVPYT